MKNLLFLGLLCLVFSVNLFSQTEPSPLSFNWGTYTAPFHDSSHSIPNKPVLGWQWGFNDSSFDAYIGVNMVHGGSNDGNSYKFNRIGMRTILEYHKHTHSGYRYDAEIRTRLNNDFRPYKYDSSGAIFGWKWRDTSISQLDTATPQKPHGAIKINGSGLVLKNMSPNRGFGRAIGEDPATRQKIYLPQQLWYLTVRLRRTDSTNTDTTINPALSLRIKYWARNLSDSTKLPKADASIIFDSIPQAPTWHSRGYWNGKCIYKNPAVDSIRTIIITRKMLPLHGISGRTPDVSLSAFFKLTNWEVDTVPHFNPHTTIHQELFGSSEYDDFVEKNYHIDSLSVEVTGFGFPVTIDYIRLEEPNHKSLMLGQFDTEIQTTIQKFIRALDSISPHVRLQGISPAIEYRWWSIPSFRYFNKLVNGYVFSNPAENIHHHISHAIQPKQYWRFHGLDKVDGRVAAPFYRKISGVNCSNSESLGWTHGYLMAHNDSSIGWQWANFGDTTKSHYETSVVKWGPHDVHGHPEIKGYMTRAELQSIDTMSRSALSKYVDNHPYTFQIALDYKYAENDRYGDNDKTLYSEIPWWSQKLIHTIWQIKKLDNLCPSPNYRTIREDYKRENTGEEIRYLLWADIVRGTKGIMIDNGGVKRLTTTFVPPDNYVLNHTGYITMRKVQELGSYNPDNPNDGDFLMQNDSTYLSKHINRARAAALFSIDSNRIYMGLKSVRLQVKSAFDFMNTHADEIMRLRLVSCMSKGYKSVFSGDTAAMGSLLRYKVHNNQTGFRLRPLGRTLSGNPYYEPKDSTFYDLTILRDKNDTAKEFDSVFYVGVVNRRTDPLRMVRTPIHDTTKPKLLKFLSFAEYIDSCKVSPDSLLWQQEYWTQHGAREITIPFKVRGRDAGDYPLLRIQEMGGTLDTVIGCDRPLAMKYLPGEGKIFRVRVLPTDPSVTGNLAHSNQRKLISFPVPVYDSVKGYYVPSADSVRYHLCYFRPVSTSDKRTVVCYRRSKSTARNSPYANLVWENEVILSNSYSHPPRTIQNDTCAYPSLVARYDTVSGQTYCYVVYGCKGYMPQPPLTGIQEPFQRIVESKIWHINATPGHYAYILADSVYTNNLAEFGTPMIAASEQNALGGNFYAWADRKRGIGVGWHRSQYNSLESKRYIRFHSDTSECFSLWKAQHPSLSTYIPLRHKGHDCALVWQENYSCDDIRSEIFTTRLRANGLTVEPYLGPEFMTVGNFAYFNADSSIYCLSNATGIMKDTIHLGNTMAMPWREQSLRHTCTIEPLSQAARIRLDAIVWEKRLPSIVFPVFGYGLLVLDGLAHYDTLIGTTLQPLRTQALSKTLISHFPYGWMYRPSLSQGHATMSDESFTPNALGCVNSNAKSLIINAVETNEAALPGGGTTWLPVYFHRELSHSIFAQLQTKQYVSSTSSNPYIHLAGIPFALTPTQRWEHRRVYSYHPTSSTALPQILGSAQYFYKLSDRFISRVYHGWKDADGYVAISAPHINGHELEWNIQDRTMSIAHDTLITSWFRINDEALLQQKIKTDGWDALQVSIQKQGEQPQRLPLSLQRDPLGLGVMHTIEFSQGDNNFYRLLYTRGTVSEFQREICTEMEDNGLSKKTSTTINLSQLGHNNRTFAVYPNPANDELSVVWSGGKATVELLDSQGLTVFSAPMTTSVTLSTKELSSGVYMVRLKQGLHTQLMSVIVLH